MVSDGHPSNVLVGKKKQINLFMPCYLHYINLILKLLQE